MLVKISSCFRMKSVKINAHLISIVDTGAQQRNNRRMQTILELISKSVKTFNLTNKFHRKTYNKHLCLLV